MAGELVHVGDDQGETFFPGSAADAAAVADAGSGHGALERAQDEFFVADAVESHPVESESGMDGGREVGHVGDFIGLAGSQGLRFLQEFLVFLFFCHDPFVFARLDRVSFFVSL